MTHKFTIFLICVKYAIYGKHFKPMENRWGTYSLAIILKIISCDTPGPSAYNQSIKKKK